MVVIKLFALTSFAKLNMCVCVCVCVCTHIHMHAHIHPHLSCSPKALEHTLHSKGLVQPQNSRRFIPNLFTACLFLLHFEVI